MVLIRVFNAPVDQVWKAWSDSEYVMPWWGPTGFTCPLAEMGFREGGTSLVCMRAPKEFGGEDMYNTWTYRKIVPLERIEFTAHFADGAFRYGIWLYFGPSARYFQTRHGAVPR